MKVITNKPGVDSENRDYRSHQWIEETQPIDKLTQEKESPQKVSIDEEK